MKRYLTSVAVFTAFTALAASGQFLVPSNPPPVIVINVTASPSPGVTNVWLYMGTNNSGQYSSKTQIGLASSYTVTNVVRGTRYFFAATAVANGLESAFSNEINYTVPLPPGPPSLTLTVQTKTGLDDGSMWADTDMKWLVVPESTEQVFRLNIAQNEAKQTQTILRLPANPSPPPIPGR